MLTKILRYILLAAGFVISWCAALVVIRIIGILVLKQAAGHAGMRQLLVLALLALLVNAVIWMAAAIVRIKLDHWWGSLSLRRKQSNARLAETIATVIMFLGVACFILSFVLTRPLPPGIRPPLISTADVVVDTSGLIYCSQPTSKGGYQSIHVYTEEGRFLRTFRPGGARSLVFTSMKIDQSDHINLADDHTRTVSVFDNNGRRLGSHPYPAGCDYVSRTDEFKDRDGSVYSVFPLPPASVWKTDPSGRTSIVVIDPPYLWVFNPVIAWIILFAGLMTAHRFKRLRLYGIK